MPDSNIELIRTKDLISKVYNKIVQETGSFLSEGNQVLANLTTTNQTAQQAEAGRVQAESERSEWFETTKPKTEQAISKSNEALNLSQSADALSKSVQEQFNQVVIEGDSSVEAAQARVDASGQTNPTLKARLDKEHNEVTAQLAQTEIKKADKTHIWPMANMGQDVKEAMTGGSVAVVGKNTILSENIVNGQVIPSKTSFAKRINLFSGDYTKFAIAGDAHNIVTSEINQRSALVRVDSGKTYTIAVGATRDTFRVGLLDREPQIGDVTKRTFTNVQSPYTVSVGDGEVYMIVTVSMKYNQPVMTVIEGNTPLPLERANTVSIDLYELENIMTKENENWSVI